MKGNLSWRDPFSTSMIMGGRIDILGCLLQVGVMPPKASQDRFDDLDVSGEGLDDFGDFRG